MFTASPKNRAAASGGAASALVLLATAEASNDSSIDFVSLITEEFTNYKILISDVIPSSNQQDLKLQYSSDNGSSFITANYDNTYIAKVIAISSLQTSGDASQDGYNITADSNSSRALGSSFSGMSGEVIINNPLSNTAQLKASSSGAYINAAGTQTNYISGSTLRNTAAINALRLKFGSGNIASGKISLYGVL